MTPFLQALLLRINGMCDISLHQGETAGVNEMPVKFAWSVPAGAPSMSCPVGVQSNWPHMIAGLESFYAPDTLPRRVVVYAGREKLEARPSFKPLDFISGGQHLLVNEKRYPRHDAPSFFFLAS